MSFKELLVKIASELDRAGIDYMVIGGQAVLVYGEPRLTKDIDITLGISPQKMNMILNVIDNIGLDILVSNIESFVKRTWVIPAIDKETGIRVDFIFSASPYEKEAMKRTVKVQIDGYHVKFVSVEDLIIQKLVSGRPRDIEDVKKILLKNPVHMIYVEKWLKEFDESLGIDTLKTFRKILKEVKDE